MLPQRLGGEWGTVTPQASGQADSRYTFQQAEGGLGSFDSFHGTEILVCADFHSEPSRVMFMVYVSSTSMGHTCLKIQAGRISLFRKNWCLAVGLGRLIVLAGCWEVTWALPLHKGHGGCAHLTEAWWVQSLSTICSSEKRKMSLFGSTRLQLGIFQCAHNKRGWFLKWIFSHDDLDCLPRFWEIVLICLTLGWRPARGPREIQLLYWIRRLWQLVSSFISFCFEICLETFEDTYILKSYF